MQVAGDAAVEHLQGGSTSPHEVNSSRMHARTLFAFYKNKFTSPTKMCHAIISEYICSIYFIKGIRYSRQEKRVS